MNENIPFEVPAKWAEAFAAGTVRRFGTVLKSVETGRIVAHLQEAGDLGRSFGDPLPVLLGTTRVLAVGSRTSTGPSRRRISGWPRSVRG